MDKLLLPYDCVFHNISAYQFLAVTLVMPLGCSMAIGVITAAVHASMTLSSAPLLQALKRPFSLRNALIPTVWHLHIWVLLMLYPSLSREAFGIFLCTEVDGRFFLNSDTELECYTSQWSLFAFIAIAVGIVGYALGLPALSFVLPRQYRGYKDRSARAWLGRRISLLLSSYTDECWWFESADLIRKLLLTGVVLNVMPGSRVQIWFGLIVSVAASILTLKFAPYRDRLCGWFQAAATLQIMFNYITAIVFFIPRGAPRSLDPLLNSPLGNLLVCVNAIAFLLIILVLAAGARSAYNAPLARWRSIDGRPVVAEPPKSGGFHAFISHVREPAPQQNLPLDSLPPRSSPPRFVALTRRCVRPARASEPCWRPGPGQEYQACSGLPLPEHSLLLGRRRPSFHRRARVFRGPSGRPFGLPLRQHGPHLRSATFSLLPERQLLARV